MAAESNNWNERERKREREREREKGTNSIKWIDRKEW